ncbi:MAG: acylphosphatase [Candidatus Chisholmbacteria bacterium]|nr:acylphosphatase [Candidatus Chisholmbacteria bacterium]
MARAHVFISGQVQGVGLRYATKKLMQQKGVSGWVENLPDGRVEAVFEGGKQMVEEMVKWCSEGPPTAVVKEVRVEWEKPEGREGFGVLPTR